MIKRLEEACRSCSTIGIEHDNKMQYKFVVLDKKVQHDLLGYQL